MSTIEPAGSVACVWCPSSDRLGTVARPTGRSSMPTLGASYRAGWLFVRAEDVGAVAWVGFVVAEKTDVEPLLERMVRIKPRYLK